MQNAPAMLAQQMMNRQAPYGPIGMVSQNMSGNKKSTRDPRYLFVTASVLPIVSGAYNVYIFNASGTFTVNTLGTDPTDGAAVEYLVIAGGGGSGGELGGGAGAGGYRTATGLSVTAQTYSITVGAGGSTNIGSSSSLGTLITNTGGGSGQIFLTRNGGSGGGAYRDTANNIAAGTGIAGQGFAGGTVTFTGGPTAFSHAGGGGAGALGGNGSITVGGNGGAGLSSSITGTSVARGGGGGGASNDGTTDYAGSATAGGGFGFGSNINGTANTGGGAGPNGSGGSGVVIIKVRARA